MSGCYTSGGLDNLGLIGRVGLLGFYPSSFLTLGVGLLMRFFTMDSCAQFLAVAEHRLIPARARSIGHQLRRANCQSGWAPACQDQISGGHAGVGVICPGCAPLAAPTVVTPEFLEFC